MVDGTGAAGFHAAVGVRGDRLWVLRGDVLEVPATRRIDATGLVVAPGFIDVHSHSGLVILAEPRHEPKVHQGVTTEVIGVDGNSYAPFRGGGFFPSPSVSETSTRSRAQRGLDACRRLALDGAPPILSPTARRARGLNLAFSWAIGAGSRHSAGRRAADAAALDGCAGCSGNRWRRGVRVSSGLYYPPGAFAARANWRAHQRGGTSGGIYHTHSGTPWVTVSSTPSGRPSRSDAGEVPVHITHFSAATAPVRPGEDRAGRGGRGPWPGRHLGYLPLRVGGTRLLNKLPRGSRRRRALMEGRGRCVRQRLRAEMGRAHRVCRDIAVGRLRLGTAAERTGREGRTLGELMPHREGRGGCRV